MGPLSHALTEGGSAQRARRAEVPAAARQHPTPVEPPMVSALMKAVAGFGAELTVAPSWKAAPSETLPHPAGSQEVRSPHTRLAVEHPEPVLETQLA